MAEPILVFFDGSYNQQYKTAAFIAKKGDEIIAAKSTRVDVPSSVYSEYQALQLGLDWANKNLDVESTLEFYGDCKPVILNVARYRNLDRSPEFDLLVDTHRKCRDSYVKLKRNHVVKLEWIPRSQNSEVDDFSRPPDTGKKWRVHLIRDINNLLVEYAKKMNIRDIQKAIVDFMIHYTGLTAYKNMSNEQLKFFHERLQELKCATIM